MLIAFILLIPTAPALAVYHYAGYFNGRYDRLSAEAAARKAASE